jgi:predicted PurR-regulated permease PerM/phosphoglycolate phosphatase-like HAD superfamily hydrolase
MQESTWSNTTKLVVLMLLLIIGGWALVRFSAAIPSLIVSALLAFLLSSPTSAVVRHTGLPRGVAVLLVFLVLLVLIILAPVLITPSLVSLASNVQFDFEAFNKFVDSLGNIALKWGPIDVDVRNMLLQSSTGLQQFLTTYVSQAALSLLSMLSSLFWLAFVVVVTFWLIKDGYKLENWFFEHLPRSYRRDVTRLLRELSLIWGSFFKGTLVLAFIVGALVGLAMWILGLKHVMMLAIFAGFMEFIPSLGPTLGALLAVFVAFFGGSSWVPLDNWMFALIVMAVYLLIFQFEQVYLYPRVVGRRVNLHPGVVFVGAILGAVEFGLLGVLLAAPTLASARVLGRYILRRLMDLEPFPEEPEKVATAIQWRGLLRGQPVAAILFDLDGTLAETDDQIIEDLARRLGPLQGFFPDENARPYVRRWVMRLEPVAAWWLARLDAVDLDDDAFRGVKRIRRLLGYRKTSELEIVPGTGLALRNLRVRYRLGLVTTRDRRSTLRFLTHHHLDDLFDVVITRDDVRRLKPHPEPIFKAAETLGLSSEQCVMVGDTLADIRSARAANAAAVGVLTGFGGEDDLDEADLVLESVVELVQWL